IANAGSLATTGATFSGDVALGSTTSIGSPAGGNQGGAIGNLDGASATIKLSTFTDNQALGTGTGDAAGGAIANEEAFDFPFTEVGVTCSLSQCTFANNVAEGGSNTPDQTGGGAIEDEPGVNLTILNCSFTGNQAENG